MLPCPRQPVFFPLPCSSLLWSRCVRLRTTRLSRRPCIHRRFPGNLRRARSKQPCSRPFLLTAVAPPLWSSGRTSRPRRPLPLPFPSRVGSGRGARVRRPFRLPQAALAVPVANVVVLGNSPPDWVSPSLQVGGCLSAHWRHWQAIGVESWVLSVLRDGYRIPFLDSPPPLARIPMLFPTYWLGSP